METHDYYFEEIVYVLSKVHRVDFLKIEEDFWDMYILDLILANPDRHRGNWGLCLKDSKRTLSSIFDNGASLLPRAKFIDGSAEWWYNRTYIFPNSKIMFRPPVRERSNYYDTWNSGMIPYIYKEKFINMSKCISYILYDKLFENELLVPLEAQYFISKLIELRYRCIVLGEDFNIVYSNLIADEVYHNN